MDRLIEEIIKYRPWTEEERWEQQQIIDFVKKNPDCLLRSNQIAHMTASGWVVNKDRSKVVMAYHKIYDAWAWLGGHADGERDLLRVAQREACEEAGLKRVLPVSEDIFSMETLVVEGHQKNGSWVPSHLHLNLTYLLEADESEALHNKEDENSGVRWVPVSEVEKICREPWMVAHVYRKLIEKTQRKYMR